MAEKTTPAAARAALAYSPSELMVVAAAREIRDGEVVMVGHGIPNLAADLAKLLYAPSIVCLFEIGVIDPLPGGEPNVGSADPRLWRGAVSFRGTLDVMGTLLQRGRVDVGFLGALEVDRYGNVNSTEVLTPEGKPRRFGGSGGGNDIASHARRVIIVCRHGRQKLVERVRFLTSPGHVCPEGRLLLGGGRCRFGWAPIWPASAADGSAGCAWSKRPRAIRATFSRMRRPRSMCRKRPGSPSRRSVASNR